MCGALSGSFQIRALRELTMHCTALLTLYPIHLLIYPSIYQSIDSFSRGVLLNITATATATATPTFGSSPQ